MNKLEQKQLLFLKKNYFTSAQKTLCKKFEQYGGEFTFKVENEPFKIIFKQSKAYTNFLFESKLIVVVSNTVPSVLYDVSV